MPATTSQVPSTSWDGRFPAAIGGAPVLLGNQIPAHIADATNDAQFLVGGVISEVPPGIDCFDVTPPPLMDSAFLTGSTCSPLAPYLLSAAADGSSIKLFWSPSHPSAPDIGKRGDVLVYRVHVRDPRFARCPSDWQSKCLSTVFIDRLVWRNGAPVMADQ